MSSFESRATFHLHSPRTVSELSDEAGLLVVVLRGAGMWGSEGRNRILAPGDTALLNPRARATFTASSSGSGTLLLQIRLQGWPETRGHLASQSPFADSRPVAEAIRLMQSELGRRWTVAELARKVGLSRAAFARRFKEATTESPQKHLAGLRLARAADLLEHSELGLAELAELVGYRSEFAFNRAFKRRYGLAPGTFRRSFRSAPVMLAAA